MTRPPRSDGIARNSVDGISHSDGIARNSVAGYRDEVGDDEKSRKVELSRATQCRRATRCRWHRSCRASLIIGARSRIRN